MDEQKIRSIISTVTDPEIPVLTISDLGILRNIELSGDQIKIQITPTYSGCPAMEVIREDIRSALAKHGYTNVEIQQVLSPAWTSDWMSESGKEKLEAFGIAAPAKRLCSADADDHPRSCPNCHSTNLEMVSRFSSTACKALYRCKDCLEPFDYFKCH